MDIGVKERVIGAVVLVVLGIIIIPWVLQGPSPDTAVTRQVALPAATTTSTPQEYRMDLSGAQTPPLASNPAPAAPAPSPAVAPQVSRPGAVNPAASKPRPVTGPQPVERSSKASANVSGGWLVQAGSYGSERNALKLQATLKQHGYAVHISRYQDRRNTYYRVRVGPYAERTAAEKAIPAINRIYGGKAKVVPNN